MYITIMALCGTTAVTSVQRRVWMQRQSQEWWDRGVRGLVPTFFPPKKFQDDMGDFSQNRFSFVVPGSTPL